MYSQSLLKLNGVVLGGGRARRDFRASPFALSALRRLVTIARARGVPTLLWWSPSPADSVDSTYLPGAQRAVLEVQAELPWLQIPQSEPPAWPPSWFGSVTHTTPEGAELNSRELAAAIRRLDGTDSLALGRLAGTKWSEAERATGEVTDAVH
jgi:hypothetical protein